MVPDFKCPVFYIAGPFWGQLQKVDSLLLKFSIVSAWLSAGQSRLNTSFKPLYTLDVINLTRLYRPFEICTVSCKIYETCHLVN